MSRQDLELLRLRKEVDRLTYHTKEIPSRWAGGAVKVRKLFIIDGNTVYAPAPYYGIKRSGTLITTVPSLYDPNAYSSTPGSFSAVDGIGRAIVYVDGISDGTFVLVVHDTRSLHPNAMVNGDYTTANGTVSIPVGAGPDVINCYTIDFP